MSTTGSTSEFAEFCAFVVHMRDAGAADVTPEQSVEEFRKEQEKLRIWNERNAESDAQAARGEYGPLDLDEIMRRVTERVALRGNAQ